MVIIGKGYQILIPFPRGIPKIVFIMKKTLIAAVAIAAVGALTATAQVVEQPNFFDNWSIGLDGGVTTPLKKNPFFKSMRGTAGIHIQKQITPAFAIGAESLFGVNTSSWKGRVHSANVFDNSYVGLYGAVDLFNLFGGYQCEVRPFTIEAVAGAGWGHYYFTDSEGGDHNFLGTKAGLNFNFNVNDNVTIGIKPSVLWDMESRHGNRGVTFDANRATFQLLASVGYRFGDGFQCVAPYNQAEVDALNAEVNGLRAALATATDAAAAATLDAAATAAALDSCLNAAPQVVKEVTNNYNSVRFVFFRIGSSAITPDQMPNIEMISDYMKNHPDSKVVIKGYASKDGNYDFNIKLAQSRAESVKNALVKKYKIPADRISAQGEGIGNMFEEESWNRVSICTLENDSDNK